MDWEAEKALMQRQYQDLAQRFEKERTKAIVAAAKRDEAYARATKAKLEAKSAVLGLERYKVDGARYQWLRAIGIRFPGSGDGYAHNKDADRMVDQFMKLHSYPPTMTEERIDPSVSRRRPRDLLNPALPPELAAKLSLKARASA